ncbi:hypothetical protein [Adlercreutzia sp. CNCM I-6216]
MSAYEIGDERVMQYAGVEHSEDVWIDNGELVRCSDCVNWGAESIYAHDYCQVVRKYVRPSDWCCWGAGKGVF